MFKKFLLEFPFLKTGLSTYTISTKIVLATALLKPSALAPPTSLIDNLYKGTVALSTKPFTIGSTIKIDKYDGVVRNMNIWYLTLERSKGYVYIPSSHVYNSVIEVQK